MDYNYDEIEQKLKDNNQSNLLKIFNKLGKVQKEKLKNEINKIDFKQMQELYLKATQKPQILSKKLEHINYVDEYGLDEKTKNIYANIGEESIRNNEYAVVTMAGGQGTRLGHRRAKRNF